MPEKKEPAEKDWVKLEQAQRYELPARQLNPKRERRYFLWEGRDQEHRAPLDWLTHHAKAFHFTDDELLSARTDDLSVLQGICGVYIYFAGEECLYVGQSVDAGHRAIQHRRAGIRWSSHVCFEVPRIHVDTVEAYYIHRLHPTLNTKYPQFSFYADLVEKNGWGEARKPTSEAWHTVSAPTRPSA